MKVSVFFKQFLHFLVQLQSLLSRERVLLNIEKDAAEFLFCCHHETFVYCVRLSCTCRYSELCQSVVSEVKAAAEKLVG